MSIYGKALCHRKLKLWLEAEEAIATGQSYQIDDRRLTRADLNDVRKEIEFWEGKLAAAEAEEQHGGRNRAYRAVIRDV